MTPLFLLEELKQIVEKIVIHYELFDENGDLRTPPVFAGFAPTKQSDDYPESPCVVVRVVSGKDESEDGTVKVMIGVYTYQESARDDTDGDVGHINKTKGWDTALEIIWRIRISLLEHRLLAKKFNLKFPLEWEVPETQPEPIWGSFMYVNYSIDVPENLDYVKELTGYGDKKNTGVDTGGCYDEQFGIC